MCLARSAGQPGIRLHQEPQLARAVDALAEPDGRRAEQSPAHPSRVLVPVRAWQKQKIILTSTALW